MAEFIATNRSADTMVTIVETTDAIGEALDHRKDGIVHRLSSRLAASHPGLHILETEDSLFSISDFSVGGGCKLTPKPGVHSQLLWGYDGRKSREWATPYNTWFQVEWEGKELEVVTIGFLEQHCRTLHHFVLSPSESASRSFLKAVCAWNHQVRDEVLVFDGGHWQKSKDLFADIKTASFDNLVLPGTMREDLISDLSGFFASKAKYDQYGIAWKRGVLLLGPPGNGKTHAVKATINHLNRPCLYVKSFKAQYRTDHDSIRSVFKQARETAPCILVFEDLDSLIDSNNRSFFLNEMDGFASNSGILSVATTNHPERLDPSILDRPSRFDRKYTFDLPEHTERRAFLILFGSKLEPDLVLTPDGLDEIVAATEEYSYAYLKELYLASMIKWIGEDSRRRIDEVMLSQCETLKGQMATEPPADSVEGDVPDFRDPYAYARKYMVRLQR